MISFLLQSFLGIVCFYILYGAAITIQILIKVFIKYLDYRQISGQEEPASSTSPTNQAASINNKHTVSLGSALFFALVLLGGLTLLFVSRRERIFFFLPLILTIVAVFFPIFIIFGNPKLKMEFYQTVNKPLSICLKHLPNNMIQPIV